MRWIVVSDIHGNLTALEAVLRDAGEGPILCAGDITGYGAYPAECVGVARERSIQCVRGNHDDAIADSQMTRDEWFNDEARIVVSIHRRLLGEDQKAWLHELPTELRLNVDWALEKPRRDDALWGTSIAMYHGSPTQHLTQYVTPREMEAHAHLFLGHTGAKVVVLGHTHMAHVVKRPAGIVVNPGSVGQPRDGDPRASYATVTVEDYAEPEVEIHRVEYDIDAAAQAIEEKGLPYRFARRLYTGT